MLVLHSSSCCDVCLDAYTFQTIAQTPHVISCGHIFCRSCLFALNPLVCPLCRQRFDPTEAKNLHADQPETLDENKEVDLLQRMAISAEDPEDQLQELLNEVDAWLDSRADDTCLVLRQARATLTRYLELKKLRPILEGVLNDFQEIALISYAQNQEHTKLEADNNALISENENLKAEVQELRTVSEQHGYRKSPLHPPQPQDQVLKLPSVKSFRSHAQPFKVQGHKHHKGKAKSLDHRLISPSPNQDPPALPTQQTKKSDPSEESPALVSHFDHRSPLNRQRLPTPPSGLKSHFEITNQPLGDYELTHTHLRQYSLGVLDGQPMAEKQPSTSHQTQVRENQSLSGPFIADTHRPLHQRHSTSPESSTKSGGSSSRSIQRSNPSLAAPDMPPRSHTPSFRTPSFRSYTPAPPIPALPRFSTPAPTSMEPRVQTPPPVAPLKPRRLSRGPAPPKIMRSTVEKKVEAHERWVPLLSPEGESVYNRLSKLKSSRPNPRTASYSISSRLRDY